MKLVIPIGERGIEFWLQKASSHPALDVQGTNESGMFRGDLTGSYKVEQGNINIEITKKPFYVTEGMLQKLISQI